MDAILMIGMLLMGIRTLTTGKIKLTANKVLDGAPARLVGMILMTPLPLTFGIAFIFGRIVAGQTSQTHLPDGVEFLGFETSALAAILAVAVGWRSSRAFSQERRDAIESKDYRQRVHCYVCMRDYDKGGTASRPKPCPTCGRFIS